MQPAFVDARSLEEADRAPLLALNNAHPVVCCDVNLDPPNPASDSFHAGFGFAEVGRARLASGKQVRYLVRHADRFFRPALNAWFSAP